MAFLDNSGDIILDAVLTDTGRMRLAKGDGSFRIVKFALADDEIDYSLYDRNNLSGSAYYDLEILQTPVLEAFTNNASSMKSKLLSISRNNLLYLPVIKVNNIVGGASNFAISSLVSNGYLLAVDEDTEELLANTSLTYTYGNTTETVAGNGILNGFTKTNGVTIQIDQGIDNINIPASTFLPTDLKESQYFVEIDNRFGAIYSPNGLTAANPSFIDDDNIATYTFSLGTDTEFVNDIPRTSGNNSNANQVIDGARGTYLKFKLASALEVQTSPYLFNTLGSDETSNFGGVGSSEKGTVKTILSNIRITGATTGYSVDIPILLIRRD
jgi:hypothetical protein